jgi:hypothetical protein
MPQTCRRVVSILCLVAFLGLPLMAQPAHESRLPVLSFLSTVWERLTGTAPETTSVTSVTSAWAADVTEPTATTTTAPSPGETGRGGWDPNG